MSQSTSLLLKKARKPERSGSGDNPISLAEKK